jgi:hypothetical protein
MNQICIAKKVSHQNVEFLDFALNDADQLIVFETFKDASEFLKSEVGTGEALLDYIITTTEAQKSNPRMLEILKNDVANYLNTAEVPEMPPVADEPTENSEVEIMFVFDASNYEILNHQKIYDKKNQRTLVPVVAFLDEKDTTKPAEVDNFKLITVFIDKSEHQNG